MFIQNFYKILPKYRKQLEIICIGVVNFIIKFPKFVSLKKKR